MIQFKSIINFFKSFSQSCHIDTKLIFCQFKKIYLRISVYVVSTLIKPSSFLEFLYLFKSFLPFYCTAF